MIIRFLCQLLISISASYAFSDFQTEAEQRCVTAFTSNRLISQVGHQRSHLYVDLKKVHAFSSRRYTKLPKDVVEKCTAFILERSGNREYFASRIENREIGILVTAVHGNKKRGRVELYYQGSKLKIARKKPIPGTELTRHPFFVRKIQPASQYWIDRKADFLTLAEEGCNLAFTSNGLTQPVAAGDYQHRDLYMDLKKERFSSRRYAKLDADTVKRCKEFILERSGDREYIFEENRDIGILVTPAGGDNSDRVELYYQGSQLGISRRKPIPNTDLRVAPFFIREVKPKSKYQSDYFDDKKLHSKRAGKKVDSGSNAHDGSSESGGLTPSVESDPR